MSAPLLDKLLLPLALPIVLWHTFLAIITGPFRGEEAAPTYGAHVTNTLVRTVLGTLKVEVFQWLIPSLTDTYKTWCARNKITPDIIDIPQTQAKGFWMGNKDTAKFTLVFIHGGGWALPGTSQHIDFMLKMLKWSNGQLAIFAIDYTLSPKAAYPIAIGECVEGLRYILNLPGHTPANTILGGDSAGGDMVLAILSHVSGHPHPQSNIVKPLNLPSDLKAAFAISPWVTSDPIAYPSWTKYAHRDVFGPASRDYWIANYRNGAPDDEYISPALVDPSWWSTTRTKFLLLTGGGNETLIDGISDLARKYAQGAGEDKVRVVVGERELHISPVTEPLSERRLDELGFDKCQEAALRWFIKNL